MRKLPDYPDLILTAKKCYSFAERPRSFEAAAVRAGRIMATGSRRSIARLKHRATKTVDLGDAVVTPGLVDCHTHLVYWALHRAHTIDVSDCGSLAETLTRIRKQARKRALGDWITAIGFNHNRWPEGLPDARDLDRAAPDKPAVVFSRDTHTAWLNTVGMKRAGFSAGTRDPKGGRFLRDTAGRPNGILLENAVDLLPDPVWDFAARTDAAAIRAVDRALTEAYRVAWSFGLTGMHTMDGAESLSHLQRQHREGRLGVRVVHAVPLANMPHAAKVGLRSGLGDDWLRIGAVKIFADGALGSQTAYMFQPYPGTNGHCGVPIVHGQELRETVVDAARRGWACWIHAIGDRAVHEVVEALAAARKVETTPLPHRIEHVQCIRPADIRKMARLGVIASVQPCHIMGDIRTAQRHWPRASKNAYPFRALHEAGVTLALGSDVPIESNDPRLGLFGAAVRTEYEGYPAGGWRPEQRLSIMQALLGFTRGAAAGMNDSTPRGTLEVGAAADMTIWHDDPLKAAGADLLSLRIGGVVIDGRMHLTGGV